MSFTSFPGGDIDLSKVFFIGQDVDYSLVFHFDSGATVTLNYAEEGDYIDALNLIAEAP
jgi:hypothetical protein